MKRGVEHTPVWEKVPVPLGPHAKFSLGMLGSARGEGATRAVRVGLLLPE